MVELHGGMLKILHMILKTSKIKTSEPALSRTPKLFRTRKVFVNKCVQQRYLMSRDEANISNNVCFPILFSTHLVREVTEAWSYGKRVRSCMSAHASSPNFVTCFVQKFAKLNKNATSWECMKILKLRKIKTVFH